MWLLFFLKLAPLVVTLALTIALPFILSKRTHNLAVSNLLVAEENKDPEGHDTLEYLLSWRDLMSAVITALFVLLFAVAEKITEKITSKQPITLDASTAIAISLIFI